MDIREDETNIEGDILPSELVKRLQERVSIFNREECEENFNKMLSEFLDK